MNSKETLRNREKINKMGFYQNTGAKETEDIFGKKIIIIIIFKEIQVQHS